MEFTKPVLAYAEIWPLIAVLGVACLGVLAEALLARPHRHRAQVLLAGTGLVAALVGTVVVAHQRSHRRPRPRNHAASTAACSGRPAGRERGGRAGR